MSPFQVLAAGCGGYQHRAVLAPDSCQAPVARVGLMQTGRPGGRRHVWLAFTCADHAHMLVAPRPLLPRDQAVLDRRRARRDTQLAGRRWDGDDEQPLAVGAAGDRLLERARAWAAARETGPHP